MPSSRSSERALLVELACAARGAPPSGRLAPQQPLAGRVAAVAGEQRAGEPAQRRLLRSRRRTGRRGRARVGSGSSRDRLAAPEHDRAGRVVDRRDGPAGAALARVLARVARVEVVLLRREGERVLERLRSTELRLGARRLEAGRSPRRRRRAPRRSSSNRRKYHHQPGRASRRWYSSSCASEPALVAARPPPSSSASRSRVGLVERVLGGLASARARSGGGRNGISTPYSRLGLGRAARAASRAARASRGSPPRCRPRSRRGAPRRRSSSQRSNSITASLPELDVGRAREEELLDLLQRVGVGRRRAGPGGRPGAGRRSTSPRSSSSTSSSRVACAPISRASVEGS